MIDLKKLNKNLKNDQIKWGELVFQRRNRVGKSKRVPKLARTGTQNYRKH